MRKQRQPLNTVGDQEVVERECWSLELGTGVELMMRAGATTGCTGPTIEVVRRESHVSSSFDSWRLSWPWSFFQGGILIVPPDFQFQKETSRRKPQVLFQEIVFLAELGFPF